MKVKSADLGKKLVKKATKLANPVESLKCAPENWKLKNGEAVKLEYLWATHLSDEQFEWVFDLFNRNMEDLYRKSEWGYEENSKRSELQATTARYIIVKNSKNENIGYMHYRFTIEIEQPVLYCYELQVEPKYQNEGVGSMMLDIAAKVARKTGMVKVYATVFKFNEFSLNFFKKRGFEIDSENYPELETETDYYILELKL
ncbi:N-alpha-acetyltransferase 40 [Aphelenchoides besseyi]|nr:N-alpha-acetyltransferase 40 [Aphelenchoides besseyi]